MEEPEEEQEGKPILSECKGHLLSEERLSELLTKLMTMEEDEQSMDNLLTAEESRAFSEFVKK